MLKEKDINGLKQPHLEMMFTRSNIMCLLDSIPFLCNFISSNPSMSSLEGRGARGNDNFAPERMFEASFVAPGWPSGGLAWVDAFD